VKTRLSIWRVAVRTVVIKEHLSFSQIGLIVRGLRQTPLALLDELLAPICWVQAGEVGDQIVTPFIVKEKSVRGHDGVTADTGRIEEMRFEP